MTDSAGLTVPGAAEVRVGALHIAVRASHAECGLQVLNAAEQALPRVLAQLGQALGDEVLVLHKVEIRLLARSAGEAGLEQGLEQRLRSRLEILIEDAREQRGSRSISYPSRAHALAAYLGALTQGQASAWPFTAFHAWGAGVVEVWEHCIGHGLLLVADTLALLSRDSSLIAVLPTSIADKLLSLLQQGSPERRALLAADLPTQVLERLAQALSAPPRGLSPTQEHLILLGALFAEWPPARAFAVQADDLAAELTPKLEATLNASSAGGLVFWGSSFARLELDLDSIYPGARANAAVRWAVARTLEAASMSPRDPLLLIWSGEAPSSAAQFGHALEAVDPEPLHALALSLARRLGYLDGNLRIVPLGDEQVALGAGDLILDSVSRESVDSALPLVVRNFTRRAAGVELSVELVEKLDSASLDAIAEVDAAFAADAWRGALRAFTSVLRCWLRRKLGCELRVTRGWRARCTDDAIELRRSDASRVQAGAWLRGGELSIAGRRFQIRLA